MRVSDMGAPGGRPGGVFARGRNAMARCNQTADGFAIESGRSFTHPPSDRRASVRRESIPAAARAVVLVFLFSLGSAYGWTQQKDQQPAPQKGAQKAPQ